ncbi:hypothetical protein ACFQ0B_75145 [Nonomuraea thailandensis]
MAAQDEPERPAAARPAQERAAVAAARTAGKPVEVESMRSETRTVFAQPDGTMTMELNVRPVRVRKEGRWVPVDTTLRLRPDGTVEPVAAAVDLAFSGGGSARWPACRAAPRRWSWAGPARCPSPR